MTRATATEGEKEAERARVIERRAKFTPQEAAAATQRNTEQRRLARSKVAESRPEEKLVLEVSEKGVVLSKKSVPVGADKNVAPLPELVTSLTFSPRSLPQWPRESWLKISPRAEAWPSSASMRSSAKGTSPRGSWPKRNI